MDTTKLITVVVWATIVLVVYELFKQLGSSTNSNVASGLAEVLAQESSTPMQLTDQLSIQDQLEASSYNTGSNEFAY